MTMSGPKLRSPTVNEKLFYREIHGNTGAGSQASIYGSRKWVSNLDIVGELRGHDGCINALQWSRSGALLASGSDDTRVNIYKAYAGFSLDTQIETGHTQNIFSVKFMPYSNDQTIVTAAGDSQIRVFDIEYAPTTYSSLSRPSIPTQPTQTAPPSGPRRRRHVRSHENPTPGKTHYSAKRVYESHLDRAKRIVTESSPHLFLTCSEDGTVRQFDLRQPSEFYTRPGANSMPNMFYGLPLMGPDEEDERNPPLISYRRHGIDLNTISCSTSRPHYIALGGTHLYCFLHDRRMLGRDLKVEAGQSTGGGSSWRDARLTAATQCVRRFSPRMGKHWDRDMQNSHVTACKISDANPNEVVASWSGDGIYLFDINRSPDPTEEGLGREPWNADEHRSRTKRERVGRGSARKRPRNHSPSVTSSSTSDDDIVPGHRVVKIASLVVDIRRQLFGLASSNLLADTPDPSGERRKSYDAALSLAYAAFKRINRSLMQLDAQDIAIFRLLRTKRTALRRERNHRSNLAKNRRRVRTFTAAALCLSQALGGYCERVGERMRVNILLSEAVGFRYRFLRAVINFLEKGVEGIKDLAQEFRDEEAELESDAGSDAPPSLIPADTEPRPLQEEHIDRFLRDLERGAVHEPIRDVDTNEVIFETEFFMVTAFRRAVQQMSGEVAENVPDQTSRRFWGERVARGVLMKEGLGIDFQLVERAFGEDTPDGPEIEIASDPISGPEEEEDVDEDEDEDMPTLDDDGDNHHDEDEDEAEEEEDEDDYGEDEDEDEDDEDGSGDDEDSWFRRRRNFREPIEPQAPIWEHTKVYRGHRNQRTVKDVDFFGLNDEYVVSGSDCGHLFIWDKNTTKLVQLLYGDDETVNVAVGHPHEPMIAVSGIDYTVKLFSPDTQLQKEFGQPSGTENFFGRGEDRFSGHATRRKMDDAEEIIADNQIHRDSGISNAVITSEMVSQLIANMRAGGVAAGPPNLENGECPLM